MVALSKARHPGFCVAAMFFQKKKALIRPGKTYLSGNRENGGEACSGCVGLSCASTKTEQPVCGEHLNTACCL